MAMMTSRSPRTKREDIRRDLAEGMKFVPPDLRVGERVLLARCSEQHSARTEIWRMVEEEIIAIKGPIIGPSIFQNMPASYEDFWTLDLEEPLDSSDEQEHLCYGLLVKVK